MKFKIISTIIILCLLLLSINLNANYSNDYNSYINRLLKINSKAGISKDEFKILDKYEYKFKYKDLEDIEIIPTIFLKYNRVVLFFVNSKDNVLFFLEDLECNNFINDNLTQTNYSISSLSFDDLNEDGFQDIILISKTKILEGRFKGKYYTIGDVIFQNENGFYRDHLISDKINRFDMNKNSEIITAFVKHGVSTEYLYKSETLDQLKEGGLQIIKNQTFDVILEKFGLVKIVSGFYDMSDQYYLILYIVDENGKVLWNLQPMNDYINFYDMKGISFQDIDGDGSKDILIMANYVNYDEKGIARIIPDYNIYLQRAGFFTEEMNFKNEYKMTKEDNLYSITQKARKFLIGGNYD